MVAGWDEDVGAAYRRSEERPDDDRSSVLRRDILDYFDDVQDATGAMVERWTRQALPASPRATASRGSFATQWLPRPTGSGPNRDAFAAIPLSDVQSAASIEGAMTVFGEQVEAVYAAVERLDERSPVLRQE